MYLESKFDSNRPWRSRHIAVGRYADDLLGASKKYCLKCLRYLLRKAYGSSIAFENEDDPLTYGEHSVIKFLDGVIIVGRNTFALRS